MSPASASRWADTSRSEPLGETGVPWGRRDPRAWCRLQVPVGEPYRRRCPSEAGFEPQSGHGRAAFPAGDLGPRLATRPRPYAGHPRCRDRADPADRSPSRRGGICRHRCAARRRGSVGVRSGLPRRNRNSRFPSSTHSEACPGATGYPSIQNWLPQAHVPVLQRPIVLKRRRPRVRAGISTEQPCETTLENSPLTRLPSGYSPQWHTRQIPRAVLDAC